MPLPAALRSLLAALDDLVDSGLVDSARDPDDARRLIMQARVNLEALLLDESGMPRFQLRCARCLAPTFTLVPDPRGGPAVCERCGDDARHTPPPARASSPRLRP